jgi:hypothetical protein
VVSIVTTWKNPLIRIACSFIFRVIVTLCIIMHAFVKSKIIFVQTLFYFARMAL